MKKGLKLSLLAAAAALIMGMGATTYYYYGKYQSAIKNPEQIEKEKTSILLKQVNTMIELPQDETPTVATVLDKEKLKEQTFFKNTQNGDKVIVFLNAKKALLYRPSTSKIIEVAPVYTDNPVSSEKSDGITTTP